MAVFDMCPACRREYENPEDRRFHAEPTACPVCGPRVWLEYQGKSVDQDVLATAAQMLHQGKILAIKGLGGFHLAADAANDAAVRTLRARKGRVDKPFAVMVRDLEPRPDRICRHLSDLERSLLLSRAAHCAVPAPAGPRRLPPRGPGPQLPGAAPALHPPAPSAHGPGPRRPGHDQRQPQRRAPGLHQRRRPGTRLAGLADAFLMHDRDIQVPCDDSVVRPVGCRCRDPPAAGPGLCAPDPSPCPWILRAILGVGAEQKNTFCLAWAATALMSQHIGDLDTLETFEYYQLAITHFEELCRKDPAIVAHDLHPRLFQHPLCQGAGRGPACRGAAPSRPRRRLPGGKRAHRHLHRPRPGRHGLRPGRHGLGRRSPGGGPGQTLPGRAIWRRCASPGARRPSADPARMAAAYLYAAYGEDFLGVAEKLGLSFPDMERILLQSNWPRAGTPPSPPAPDASLTRWPRPWASAGSGPTKASRPWNWRWPPTKPKSFYAPKIHKDRGRPGTGHPGHVPGGSVQTAWPAATQPPSPGASTSLWPGGSPICAFSSGRKPGLISSPCPGACFKTAS